MKRAIFLLFLAMAGPAYSQNTTANAGAQSSAGATAGAGASSGSAANITQNYYSAGESRISQGLTYGGGTNNTNRQILEGGTSDRYRATIRNTPDAYAPNINGGTNPCVNGISGGGSVAGFGLALGGQWSDPNCERRNLSALLHNQGQPELAQEVLCETETVRQARARIGRPCAVDMPRATSQVVPTSAPVVVAPAPIVPVATRPTFPEWCATATAAERRRYPPGTCG